VTVRWIRDKRRRLAARFVLPVSKLWRASCCLGPLVDRCRQTKFVCRWCRSGHTGSVHVFFGSLSPRDVTSLTRDGSTGHRVQWRCVDLARRKAVSSEAAVQTLTLSCSEMEMLRESRARDKVDGVDRNACIVDRNQFFNTQVTFGGKGREGHRTSIPLQLFKTSQARQLLRRR